MPALEIKSQSPGRLCELCRVEPGPVRSARFAVFLLGHPADHVCAVHRKAYEALFSLSDEKAAA